MFLELIFFFQAKRIETQDFLDIIELSRPAVITIQALVSKVLQNMNEIITSFCLKEILTSLVSEKLTDYQIYFAASP